MDRIDVKYSDMKLFGNITKQTPQFVTMDVKYPKDFEGLLTMHPKDIDAISHGVYVPAKYRCHKKVKPNAKRQKK
jgi:hypothetical protein